MFPYYILIFLPLVSPVFSLKRNELLADEIIDQKALQKIDDTKVLSTFFFIMIVMLFFRGRSCGIDLGNYYTHYTRCRSVSWSELLSFYQKEQLYYLMNKAISIVFGNFQWLLIICALLSIVPIWILYVKESGRAFLMISIFLVIAPFPMYFSGLRQCIAMGMVVPLFYLARYKKLIPFLAVLLLSTFFHSSAIVMILIYPMYWAKITRKWLWVVAPVMAAIFIFNRRILMFVIGYISEEYQEEYSMMSETGAYGILVTLVGLAVISFIFTDESKLDINDVALRNILLMATCFQFFSPLHTIAMRFNYYFLPFVPIAVSRSLSKCEEDLENIVQLVEIGLTLFFLLIFFQKAFADDDPLNIYPYVAFWE